MRLSDSDYESEREFEPTDSVVPFTGWVAATNGAQVSAVTALMIGQIPSRCDFVHLMF